MKDSDEKEKRISHLKDIMSSVKKIDEEEYDYEEDEKPVFQLEEETEELIEPLEDDFEFEKKEEEIIETNEIDDEFIFNPSKSSQDAVILKDNEIDDDFIVKTDDNDIFPEISDFKEDKNGDFKSIENTFRDDEVLEDENPDDDVLYNQLTKITTWKLRNISVLGILGIFIGVCFIISALFVVSGGSSRIVDNVVSGELNGTGVFLLFIGVILLIFSIYKTFSLKNPFGDLASSMDNLEKDNTKKIKKHSSREEPTTTKIKEPPIDREAYKIGEFDIASIKSNLKNPRSKLESYEHTTSSIKKHEKEEVREKPLPKKTNIEKEIDSDDVETQSIDDIFANLEEVEDLETSIPIVSVDEKVEKNSSKKNKEE
jgi:virulence-associated protein VagC